MEVNVKTQPLNWKQFLFHTLKGQFLLAGLAIAVTYLITEHTTHVLGLLPYTLLLLCPIMMMFMHGGHGDHNGNHAGHSAQLGNGQSDSPQSQQDGESDHQGHVH